MSWDKLTEQNQNEVFKQRAPDERGATSCVTYQLGYAGGREHADAARELGGLIRENVPKDVAGHDGVELRKESTFNVL